MKQLKMVCKGLMEEQYLGRGRVYRGRTLGRVYGSTNLFVNKCLWYNRVYGRTCVVVERLIFYMFILLVIYYDLSMLL